MELLWLAKAYALMWAATHPSRIWMDLLWWVRR